MDLSDDKKPLATSYPAPPPPSMHHHRMPPPLEASHAPPPAAAAHGLYEPSWRPYPPSFDAHPAAAAAAADQRRASSNNPPHHPPIPPAHAYPIIPNRELPQLPPEGPYGRPNSLPGPATSPDAHAPPPPPPGAYRMNGVSPHDAPPHSAPPEYRSRLPFPPPEPPTNGEPLPAHSIPPAQYAAQVPAPMSQTPTPFDPPGYYQSQAYGMRQRKAARAQQVSCFLTSSEVNPCRSTTQWSRRAGAAGMRRRGRSSGATATGRGMVPG